MLQPFFVIKIAELCSMGCLYLSLIPFKAFFNINNLFAFFEKLTFVEKVG